MFPRTDSDTDDQPRVVEIRREDSPSPVVLVCEHASNRIPDGLDDLGIDARTRDSHVAWDPGAMGVARALSDRLNAVLVSSTVSRLVYDCNRPPEAPDAIPARSEAFDIPGNAGLDDAARAERARTYYAPFREALAGVVARREDTILLTIHSFTPVYHGQARTLELGILHDEDARLADAMLRTAPLHTDRRVARNEPYGPGDGVTHTLKVHALPHGHLNAMVEIRNDLIATRDDQRAMADMLTGWLAGALAQVEAPA